MADNIVYVDIADGVKRVMNNTKLYVRLLTKFRNETTLDTLESALATGDMTHAQEIAHTIKGVAANLSLTELFKQCLELETQIKGGTADVGRMEAVKAAFTATLTEVDKVIAENG